MGYHTAIASLTETRFVETWYDRISRNWITQLKDEDGTQIGNALYGGDRVTAEHNHRAVVEVQQQQVFDSYCVAIKTKAGWFRITHWIPKDLAIKLLDSYSLKYIGTVAIFWDSLTDHWYDTKPIRVFVGK